MLKDISPEKITDALSALASTQSREADQGLKAFYAEVQTVLQAMQTGLSEIPPLAITQCLAKAETMDLEKLTAAPSVAVSDDNLSAIDVAKKKFDLGLAMTMISDGALGTGYSNTDNMRCTCAFTTHHTAQEMAQIYGRVIRAEDGKASVSLITHGGHLNEQGHADLWKPGDNFGAGKAEKFTAAQAVDLARMEPATMVDPQATQATTLNSNQLAAANVVGA
jgi:hypothetical protein